MDTIWIARAAATACFSALACVGLIVMFRPKVQSWAPANRNDDFLSRAKPAKRGGIVVVAALFAALWVDMFVIGTSPVAPRVATLVSIVLATGIGAVEDARAIGVARRLLLHALLAAAIVYALPDDLRITSALPFWLERALLFVAGMWFINALNLSDRIDWMTVDAAVPLMTALVVMGYLGALPLSGVVLALAAGGAMFGFAYLGGPLQRPSLGHVGNLPIALILGWLLVQVAGHNHRPAAILLALYYLSDGSVTLIRDWRDTKRDPQPAGSYLRQLAMKRGFSAQEAGILIFMVNIGLGALALVTVIAPSRLATIATLGGGALLVAGLFAAFAAGRKKSTDN